jgi:hypothetical protein
MGIHTGERACDADAPLPTARWRSNLKSSTPKRVRTTRLPERALLARRSVVAMSRSMNSGWPSLQTADAFRPTRANLGTGVRLFLLPERLETTRCRRSANARERL